MQELTRLSEKFISRAQASGIVLIFASPASIGLANSGC